MPSAQSGRFSDAGSKRNASTNNSGPLLLRLFRKQSRHPAQARRRAVICRNGADSGRRPPENRLGSSERAVDCLETLQKTRHRTGTDRYMPSDLHIPVTEFTWYDGQSFSRLRRVTNSLRLLNSPEELRRAAPKLVTSRPAVIWHP